MLLTDVHTHLTDSRLAVQIEAVLARAEARGVRYAVSNGLNPRDNLAVAALARQFPQILPAFGLYPVDAVLPEMEAAGVEYAREDAEVVPAEEAVAQVASLADQAVAIGEIGLDGYWVPEALWARQEEVFRQLLAVARRAGLPVIVHSRKRERRVMEVLAELGAPKTCWHCFGGKVKLAQQIAAMNEQYFSIPANAIRSESFRRMLETLPRTRLLLETDAPYLGPDPGTLNEPGNIAGTADFAAALWGCTAQEARAQFAENTRAFFGERFPK